MAVTVLQPEEPRAEKLSFRCRATEVGKFERAAEVAGVTVSRLLREGALRLADQVLAGAPEDERAR